MQVFQYGWPLSILLILVSSSFFFFLVVAWESGLIWYSLILVIVYKHIVETSIFWIMYYVKIMEIQLLACIFCCYCLFLKMSTLQGSCMILKGSCMILFIQQVILLGNWKLWTSREKGELWALVDHNSWLQLTRAKLNSTNLALQKYSHAVVRLSNCLQLRAEVSSWASINVPLSMAQVWPEVKFVDEIG